METETGRPTCKLRDAKDCRPLPEVGSDMEGSLPYRFQKDSPATTLALDLCPSAPHKAVLRPVCGSHFGSPRTRAQVPLGNCLSAGSEFTTRGLGERAFPPVH